MARGWSGLGEGKRNGDPGYGLHANYSSGITRVVSCYATPRIIVYNGWRVCALRDRTNGTHELDQGISLDKRPRDKD